MMHHLVACTTKVGHQMKDLRTRKLKNGIHQDGKSTLLQRKEKVINVFTGCQIQIQACNTENMSVILSIETNIALNFR